MFFRRLFSGPTTTLTWFSGRGADLFPTLPIFFSFFIFPFISTFRYNFNGLTNSDPFELFMDRAALPHRYTRCGIVRLRSDIYYTNIRGSYRFRVLGSSSLASLWLLEYFHLTEKSAILRPLEGINAAHELHNSARSVWRAKAGAANAKSIGRSAANNRMLSSLAIDTPERRATSFDGKSKCSPDAREMMISFRMKERYSRPLFAKANRRNRWTRHGWLDAGPQGGVPKAPMK